ncbi:hypothetical protein, variant [Exophiala mesophila]|uniref:ARID domain-containing protein n=1 Tax=Exophiala mesophila TaxID=212818 RepID=A0A0D2AB81_EXOME|nr:uncharacterized protein PV10_00094 [Exophiala mesophila]XP_016227773.1 hypothetical protein, variant [Exophiala mesophila]KIV96198.1 hypothetical protein PV10_00094 [Exophiala mesophila]KIV96199.1 hypothetical protein, variant [Exophiala mesophila]
MNPWLNTDSPTPNNHAGFGGPMDAGMSFLQPPQTINPAQFQNPAFLNGAARPASSTFHNPVYQTNQVIPSKRAREDSLATSPRQASGGLPGSRSQTPGQNPFPVYNPQANGAPSMSSAPAPFQHLQPTSNATPSPTVQQMSQFGQHPGNQRVATASPSPFSPQHAPPPHASPAPSDHASRVGTPHDNPQHFMPNGGFPQAFNQPQFAQNLNSGMPQMGMNPQGNMPHPQAMSQAQRSYQAQLQAQARQMQAQAQARMNGIPNNLPPAGQHPQMPPTHQGPPGSYPQPRPNNPDEFLRGLQQFMTARGRAVDPNPIICGRHLPLVRMWALVVKAGGSQKLTKMGQWGALVQQIGFQGPQIMQAAQELQLFWANNLAAYETALQVSQHKQRMAQASMQQQQGPLQMSPTKDMHPPQDSLHHRAPSMNEHATPHMQSSAPNGFTQQQHPQPTQEAPITPQQRRPSMSRQLDPQQPEGIPAQSQAQTPLKRPQTSNKVVEQEPDYSKRLSMPIQDPFKPDIFPPSRSHGPINVEEIYSIAQHIADLKPTVPTVREMGVIDIHALTMAIKSGMHAETRVALDTLVMLSTESALQLSLVDCDDLMDTLLDCAEDQVAFLSEHATEVSEEMSLSSYEDLVRSCRSENDSVQDTPDFGTVQYDLEKAADRLICITTLIRNFSFYEANFGILGQANVIKLLSAIIRYLGTTEMFLRSNRNTLDFMKDVVIYLSNLSIKLQLPGKAEGLCILHFLLAFAPVPAPISASSTKASFTMYTPALHKYMPSAVDSLAKLLAMDEPNRTYFKAIFAADAHSSPPYELLTRAFGLAISCVPASSNHTRTIIEARKPFLLQGMLAAEILAGFAPGSDHSLARMWLESDDGFAGNLLRLVGLLSADRTTQTVPRHVQAPNNRNHPEQDINGYGAITNRAMTVLKTLVQKAKTVDEDGSTIIPLGVMPKKESLLGAMIQKDIDPGILRQLCVYAGLEE